MRLIDADEVEKILKHIREKYVNRLPKANQLFWDTIRYIEKKVRSIPTVEAKEVVHGEWIRVPSSDMATGQAYECSNCKKMRYGSFLPPFCQMCGADMRTSAE